ncbi:MAG: hypothetical protein FIO02_03005 [Nitrosopumilales archaeon]|nr:hypothetical protein [Nitrosopumilales archaeon]
MSEAPTLTVKNLDRNEADIFLMLLLEADRRPLILIYLRQQYHLKFMFHSHHYWNLVDTSEKVDQLKVYYV